MRMNSKSDTRYYSTESMTILLKSCRHDAVEKGIPYAVIDDGALEEHVKVQQTRSGE
jgi:hypothetical protein